MNRRSFMAGLAGLPIVGLGARMFGLPKPTAKSGITVLPLLEKGVIMVLPAGYDAGCFWGFDPGSHRPVDFEVEILKALEGRGRDGRETEAA